MTKTGEQAAKEAPETAQVLRVSDYSRNRPRQHSRAKVPCLWTRRAGSLRATAACWRQSSSGLMKCLWWSPGWDDALLAAEMADLKGLDFDITLTGFALDDIQTEAGDGIEDAPDSKYKEQFGVIVICKDEAPRKIGWLGLRGASSRDLIWPRTHTASLSSKSG